MTNPSHPPRQPKLDRQRPCPFNDLGDQDAARLSPTLVFSPLAWLKLQFFLHAGDTEVGGFAVSSAEDLLYVEDFATVKQEVTGVTVRFDDRAVADYADARVDAGYEPQRFLRIWVHTHPGESPLPSRTDEETFGRVFGPCDWSVMFILAKGGAAYARLAFSAGPAGNLLLPVAVDWEDWPQSAIDQAEGLAGRVCDWAAEYAAHVHQRPLALRLAGGEDCCGEGRGRRRPRTPAAGYDPTVEEAWVRWVEEGGPEVPA
jgi:proteasome lid subunit RPN8/RPN11